MPEVVDVAVFMARLRDHALDRRIETVDVRGSTVLDDRTATRLVDVLEGSRLTRAVQHGKWGLTCVDDGPWLTWHFGMTGFVVVDAGEVPDHTRLLLELADRGSIAYSCQRRLGRIGLVDSPEALADDRNLGPDVRDLDEAAFAELLDGRRGAIKSLLMNQSAMAGLGNVYADEILFNAHLDPATEVPDLTSAQRHRLHREMHRVVDMAIDRDADPTRYPRTWLTPHRDDDEPVCPRCRVPLRRGRVAQRTTWWCPRHQTS